MKKLSTACLAALLVIGMTAPALAWGHGHPGGWGHRGGWHGGFWPGYAAGAFTGLAFEALAAPYYSVPPVPVYVAPPPPTCYTQPGYWTQVPLTEQDGFTTYQNVWVPGGTVCR